MSEETKEYARGYQAGIKRNSTLKSENEELKFKVEQLELAQKERVYMACLETVLRNCENWSFGGKKINDAAGYTNLAGIFAKHSIYEINK